MNAGNLDVAIKELQTAVWLMPSNAQLHFLLSQAYRQAGKTEEAQKQTVEFQKWKVVQDPLGVPGLRPSATPEAGTDPGRYFAGSSPRSAGRPQCRGAPAGFRSAR